MRTIALLCLIPALLGGCAVYTVNNEKFYNIDDAMTAVRRGQDEVLKGVPERSPTIDAKVLVLTPNVGTTIKKAIPPSSGTARSSEYSGRVMESSYVLFGRALTQSKDFGHVDSRAVEDPEAEAKSALPSYTAVVYLHLIAPGRSGWLSLKKDSELPAAIPVDPLIAFGPPRVNAWIDSVLKVYGEP